MTSRADEGNTTVPSILHDRSAWLIRPEAFHAVRRLVAGDLPAADVRRLFDEPPQAAEARARAQNGDIAEVPRVGQVAVMKLTGIIQPTESFLSWLLFGGGGGLQTFRSTLRAVLEDDTVAGIALHINSPGGSSALVEETAAELRAARDVKPIFAVANTDACSAAYYLGSQATECSCTHSGYVGSIGVYMLHVDVSGMLEQAGVKETYVFTPEFKVDGNDSEALSDSARADWQAAVDDIYGRFVRDVAVGRGIAEATVRSDAWGKGRVLNAARAVAVGMCDRVETFEQAIDRLRAQVEGPAPIGSGAAASAAGGRPASDDAGGARADTDRPPADDDAPAPEQGAGATLAAAAVDDELVESLAFG